MNQQEAIDSFSDEIDSFTGKSSNPLADAEPLSDGTEGGGTDTATVRRDTGYEPPPQAEVPYTPPRQAEIPPYVPPPYVPPTYTPPPPDRSLDEIETLHDFREHILSEVNRQAEYRAREYALDQRVESSETYARQAHNGSDGLDSYDSLVDSYLVPLIHKDRRVFELLRQMPSPGEAAYTMAS
jgi:hypothetical protein